MASTDFDGKPIIILSEKEAHRVYNRLIRLSMKDLTEVERGIINKIARDLDLEGSVRGFNKKGTWRLSNEQLTIKVGVDSDNIIRSIAPVAYKFVGQPLSNLVRWMNRMGKTDIMLMKTEKKEN